MEKSFFAKKSERKFIMKSEDGVDLYEGDLHYCAGKQGNGKWILSSDGEQYKISETNGCFTMPKILKAFTSLEAAKTWVSKQNKPKEICIYFDGSPNPDNVLINSNWCILRYGETPMFYITVEDLNKTWQAYQSLK